MGIGPPKTVADIGVRSIDSQYLIALDADGWA
jgi:hypothetical protein